MPPNVSAPLVKLLGLWVGLLAMVVLAALVYSINKMPQDSQPGRYWETHPAFCAWCIHREGDDCLRPESPACPGLIRPLCAGHVKSEARDVICVRHWRAR